MSTNTSIEWTDATWSPLRARRKDTGKVGQHCERVSPGCTNCYAATHNRRNLPNGGTGLDYVRGSRDLVETFVDERALVQPLRWREPQKVFVCNQTDLFAEFYTEEQRDRVFLLMALAERHTFQLLTKRPDRALAYMQSEWPIERYQALVEFQSSLAKRTRITRPARLTIQGGVLQPLPNVWLGVTAEDQQRADERIPILLDTPAAVRFLSCEPLLGKLDLSDYFEPPCDCPLGETTHDESCPAGAGRIDWVIVGGESGPGARPCDVAWIRSIAEQCRGASVPVFVKQLGAHALCGCGGDVGAWARNHGERRAECARCGLTLPLRDSKGGNPSEWPEDLRVREFPREAMRT